MCPVPFETGFVLKLYPKNIYSCGTLHRQPHVLCHSFKQTLSPTSLSPLPTKFQPYWHPLQLPDQAPPSPDLERGRCCVVCPGYPSGLGCPSPLLGGWFLRPSPHPGKLSSVEQEGNCPGGNLHPVMSQVGEQRTGSWPPGQSSLKGWPSFRAP